MSFLTQRVLMFGAEFTVINTLFTTGTETGYLTTSPIVPDHHRFWKSAVGGGTFVASFAAGTSSGYELKGIAITSPNGNGMGEDIEVRFYESGNPTPLATYTIPRMVPLNMADRRFILIEDQSWRNDVTKVEIDVDGGAEISRFALLRGAASSFDPQVAPAFIELTDYFAQGWSVRIEQIGKSNQSFGQDYFRNGTNPNNYKTLIGRISGYYEDQALGQHSLSNFFNLRGMNREVVFFPYAVQQSDTLTKRKMMHYNVIFGYLIGNYSPVVTGISAADGTYLLEIPLTIRETL